VEVIMNETDRGFEDISYKGNIIITKGKEQKILTFIGDCGV